MKVLVSACLMGSNCKYNGGNNLNKKVMDFLKDKEVFPVCPETAGGLSVPRSPAEIVNGTVTTKDGKDVDREFRLGAERIMKKLQDEHIDLAVLQPRSPSCGAHQIYDGTFSKKLVSGQGIFAQALLKAGIRIIDADEL